MAMVFQLSPDCLACLFEQSLSRWQRRDLSSPLPPIEPCLSVPRTCADTNADGTADDWHDCSGHYNDIDYDPASITCASDPCTDTECCTMHVASEAPIDCSGVPSSLPCHIMFLVDEVRYAQSLSDIDPQIYCPCKLVREGALDWNPEATNACSGTGGSGR